MRKEQIAKAYRRQGLTYEAIGKLMGVSTYWASMLCDDDRRKALDQRARACLKGTGVCVDCGGPMTRNTHQASARGKNHERCMACFRAHQTRQSFNARVVNETLKCGICHQFLPFHEYPQGMLARFLERGKGKSPNCRTCDTAARVAYRERQKTPCVNCGKPRIGDEIGRRIDTGLCLDCFHESRRRVDEMTVSE
jgi:hypothetical protein